MEPQEWRELEKGDKVSFKKIEFKVTETVPDGDGDQAGVFFKGANGTRVVSYRIPGTFRILAESPNDKKLPPDFVDKARRLSRK